MNRFTRRATARSVALALLALAVQLPVHAGETCELIDPDLATENDGGSTATGVLAIACGLENSADGAGGIAYGRLNQADGPTSVALGTGNTASGNMSSAVGFAATAFGEGSIALGAWRDADNDGFVDDGELTRALGDHAVAIGSGSTASAHDSVALGSGSVADRPNAISVGAVGMERQITNVAAGTQATDAANVGQMQSGDAQTLSAANQHADEGDAATLSAANAYTDSKFVGLDFTGLNDRFDAIENRLGRQDTRIDRNGAMAAAMMNMGTNIAGSTARRGKLAVGVGFQGQQQAVSIGYGKKIGARTSFSLSGAFSGDEKSAGLGFGVEL